MAWLDQKRPASFRAVDFWVIDAGLTAGRRLARHEYPQRDKPYMEDMGRRAREYKVTGFIIGPDYMRGRDAILKAVEEAGAGQLVHPYHGTKIVTVAECELTESSEHGGQAKFTFTFVEAGEQKQPAASVDTGVVLKNSQDAAFSSVGADFLTKYSLDGLPSWGVADIQNTIAGFLSLDSFGSLGSPLASLQSDLGSLMRLPVSLVGRILDLFRSLPSTTAVLDRRPVVNSLPFQTSTRAAVQVQQANVTALFERAALIQQAGLLSNAELETSADVQSSRAEIIQRFDDHDYATDVPRPSTEVASNLKLVRTAAIQNLSLQNATLPRTYSMQLIEPRPALALAYEVYGQLRDKDVIARNAVRHPGFVQAGTPLQLTVE